MTRNRFDHLVGIVFVALLASCGGGGGSAKPAASATVGSATATAPVATPPRSCAKPVAPFETRAEIVDAGPAKRLLVALGAVGGTQRSFEMRLPANFDASKPMPVVFDFHGRFGHARDMIDQGHLDEVANAAEMVLVAGEGLLREGGAVSDWTGDVPYVEAIFKVLGEGMCVDPNHVHATGISDGAVFVAYLSCAMPGIFASVATVAEVGFPTDCADRRSPPVSIIGFHGVVDPFVPFKGGNTSPIDGRTGLFAPRAELGPSDPIEKVFADFAAHGGCKTPPVTSPVGDLGRLVDYQGCPAGISYELYVLTNGGHTWPGDPMPADHTDGVVALDANTLMVKFFQQHPRVATN